MATAEELEQVISQVHSDGRIICPECGPSRKKKYERTMSITINPTETFYCCHHCGCAGKIIKENFYSKYLDGAQQPNRPAEIKQIPTALNDSHNKLKAFFSSRGTPVENLDDLPPITTGRKWFAKLQAEVDAVGFIYGDTEHPEAIKWRPLEGKAFTQDGAARSFYGPSSALDGSSDTLIIVEGECDVVALKTIGIDAVTVPNGAPMKKMHEHVAQANDKKFSFLWDERKTLDAMKKVILCVDNDESGDILADELARRIGRAKCWRVTMPEGKNDPTEVIYRLGAEAMEKAIANAEPMPLMGVYSAHEYSDAFIDLYLKGHGKGASTGIKTVDDLFTVADAGLTVVTGLPNSGKSEFIDQIMVNTALNLNWKWAICSFENPPAMHMAKLSEKIVGKPFYEGVTPRMGRKDAEDAADFINEHFVFLDSKDGAVSTVESIIDRTKQAVMRLGVGGLVIDPYNYIEMTNDKEHKGISDMLTEIITFAKAHDIHVFFIAHPKGMIPLKDGTFPVPTGMHISGGPTWFAKADLGITVHRGNQGVEIHCWKVRLTWIGRQGMVYVDYDVPTGRYSDYVGGEPVSTVPLSNITAKAHYLDKLDTDEVDF